MIKSKRSTLLSSSFHSYGKTRDEISNSSDESDESDNDDMTTADDVPVAYEYVYGAPSALFFYKLSKAGDNNGSGISQVEKRQLKSPSKTSTQTFSSLGKRGQPHQTMHKLDEEIQSDLNSKELPNNSNKIFPRIFDSIFEFFQNRKNWSVTEESIIIWLGFMFFSIVVGCFLHFLMT